MLMLFFLRLLDNHRKEAHKGSLTYLCAILTLTGCRWVEGSGDATSHQGKSRLQLKTQKPLHLFTRGGCDT
jgi:hypothetical protein